MAQDLLDSVDLETQAINTIRFLSADAVQRAESGHPGTPMALAPVAYTLWTRHLRHHPARPDWPGRDRFVLSAGHASMLLYSLLHLSGYDLSMEALKNFRQWGSKTPGHPEAHLTAGVETTTGPLGQGVANGVGMALAERLLADEFNTPEHSMVDHYTYALCSDGDLMEARRRRWPGTSGSASWCTSTTTTASPSTALRTGPSRRTWASGLRRTAGT